MTATELLQVGDLSSTLEEVSAGLRQDPANTRKRTFLFELLCFTGDLARAQKQLDILAQAGTDQALAVQRYGNILAGETARRQTFGSGLLPGLPPEPPPYTEFHLLAAQSLEAGDYAAARSALETAEDLRPSLAGAVNGEPFDDWKDANDLLGPFLEIFTGRNYGWVPWEQIKSVTIPSPEHLRDLAYLPAKIDLHSGPLGEVYIPVLYPGTSSQPDDRVKLGRLTEFREDVDGLAIAYGQRLLVAGDRDYPLLEVRSLEFSGPVPSSHGDAGSR